MGLYQVLSTLAREERRSIGQTARQLMEDGLREHVRNGGQRIGNDDTPAHDVAALAAAGGAFDWLADEPDHYDDSCGEPL